MNNPSKTYRNSFVFLALAAIAGIYGCLHYFNSQSNEARTENLSPPFEYGSHKKEAVTASEASLSAESDLPLKNTSAAISQLRADLWGIMSQVYTWQETHGYFYKTEKITEYHSYDESTLKALADNGDLRALMMLGDKYLRAGKNKEAIYFYRNAAFRGSTAAIQYLGILLEPSQFDVNDNEDARKKSYFEVLALYRVAEMRGDLRMAQTSRESVIERRHLDLTADDYTNIDKIAYEIYDDFLRNRNALGLGDFDNIVPENVKIYQAYSDEKIR